MFHIAGGKSRLKLGVDSECTEIFVRTHILAINFARGNVAVAIHGTVECFHSVISQILAHSEGIVQGMREVVAYHFLTTRHLVIVFAFIEISWQLVRITVRIVVRDKRTFTRQPTVITRIRIVLEVTKEGEICFIIRTPAKRRRNSVTR